MTFDIIWTYLTKGVNLEFSVYQGEKSITFKGRGTEG